MTDSARNILIWILLVILVVALAFYLGMRTGGSISSATATSTPVVARTSPPAGSNYYSNPAQWQTYTDTSAGYSISYPTDFSVDEPTSISPSTDWRMNNVDQAPGIKTFTLTVPAAFEPQTNFVGATLTVGYSQNNTALADCLIAQNGEATSSTQMIGNTTFTVFTLSNPGAGQLYDTTSYRTTHAGACYAVEYTVHSAQLGNFPSSYGLQQFDESQVDAVLNQIVGTFSFL